MRPSTIERRYDTNSMERAGRARGCGGESGLTEALIAKLGYVGIALLLVLGGLGLPVPEEAPIILAAVLSKSEKMWWPFALTACFVGVLLGDFLVYFLGYFHGEKVLSLRLTQRLLTRGREAQIKGYFHRHGFKILILGRFAVGFRTAAYLTAGILKLPMLKLFLTDVLAASLSTSLMFGLGYVFAHQIETSFDQLKHWLLAIMASVLAIWLLYRYYKGRQRAGLPVGPPVLVSDDAPLPPDDLHAHPEPSPARESLPPPLPPPPPAPSPAPTVGEAAAPRDDPPHADPPRADELPIDSAIRHSFEPRPH
jgi:membrane protein DedA with SNARE-associated domain